MHASTIKGYSHIEQLDFVFSYAEDVIEHCK